MATSNPAMNEAVYLRAGRADASTNAMTLEGSVAKTGILLLILLIAAAFTWSQAMKGSTNVSYGLLMAGAIGGFITAMITIFRPQVSPITAPIYAVLEGLLLGAISAVSEANYPGIAIQAVGLCIGTLAVMLFLFGTGIIRATEKFKSGSLRPPVPSASFIWRISSSPFSGCISHSSTKGAWWALASRWLSWSSRH